ncbi:hypothetical protein VNO77_20227 [Canavalia gladiata]|uniref:Secreted protein n=1 Tax=Canavalia gladiata TaxID=3824 RepID=A0AAN9LST3_CANGL
MIACILPSLQLLAAMRNGVVANKGNMSVPFPNMSLNPHQSLYTMERYCSLFSHRMISYKGLKPYNTVQNL